MTDKWSDDEIAKAFREMREVDSRSAPPFSATHEAALARARARSAAAPWRRIAAAAAAAIALVAVGGITLRVRDSQTPMPSLSNWRSPTEFLLKSPGDYLMNALPILPTHSLELDALGVHPSAPRHP